MKQAAAYCKGYYFPITTFIAHSSRYLEAQLMLEGKYMPWWKRPSELHKQFFIENKKQSTNSNN
jgi:hypothetical protein